MRVVCQKCGAAYAIDDRVISPRGIRAQCPRCKHQQPVKREAPVVDVAPEAPPPAPEPAPPKAAELPTCSSCGVPLEDSFDQALGICDACRDKVPAREPPEPEPSASTSGSFRQLLAEAEELRLDAAAPPPAPSEAPEGPGPIGAEEPAQATLDLFAPAPPPAPGEKPALHPVLPPRPAYPPAPDDDFLTRSAPLKIVESKPSRWPLLAAAAAGLAVAATIAAVVHFRNVARPPKDEVPHALRAAITGWRLLFLEIEGTAAEHVAAGEKLLAEDKPAAYADAEEEFQQALILDPASNAAIVGYVEAISLGRQDDELDGRTYEEARALLQIAEGRGPLTVPERLAEVDLLLTGQAPDDVARARELAEAALKAAAPADQAEAHLALGRAYLPTSVELAMAQFDEALAAPRTSRRAHFYRAQAHEAAGQYRAAIEDLQKQLALDADDWTALQALARIYQECGATDRARAMYAAARQQHPDDLQIAVLQLAFAYQVDGQVKAAAAALQALLGDPDHLERRAAADGFVHLAAVQRLLGNARAAQEAAQKARELRPTSSAAALQLFLSALDERRLDEAQKELESLKGHTGDRAVEELLEARLWLARGRDADAAQACSRAAALDPRRVDALLCQAAAAARAGQRDQAFPPAQAAAMADPSRLGPRPVVTRFYVPAGEVLAGLDGQLSKLAQGEGDVLPQLYEGLLLFHQGRWAEADRELGQVLATDDRNPLALAYRSLAALQRGEVAAAVRLGARAAEGGRKIAVVRYAYGAALAQAGRAADAERELGDALQLDGGLSAAETRLAELQARKGGAASARARLVRVLVRDPSYLPAKRALYALEVGEGARP